MTGKLYVQANLLIDSRSVSDLGDVRKAFEDAVNDYELEKIAVRCNECHIDIDSDEDDDDVNWAGDMDFDLCARLGNYHRAVMKISFINHPSKKWKFCDVEFNCNKIVAFLNDTLPICNEHPVTQCEIVKCIDYKKKPVVLPSHKFERM